MNRMWNWFRRLFNKKKVVKVFCTREDLRNNCLIAYDGRKLSLNDWAELRGINVSTLRGRLVKLNWTVEKSLTKPVTKYKRRLQKTIECFDDN